MIFFFNWSSINVSIVRSIETDHLLFFCTNESVSAKFMSLTLN